VNDLTHCRNRYAAYKMVSQYGLLFLAGSAVWTVLNCKIYGIGALLQFVRGARTAAMAATHSGTQAINIIIEIKKKPPKSRYARQWNET
jgi:hypothetical protein